jgi:TetR/AcrR family transcriptional regulator, cholesterol catabolism regulator
MQQEREYAAIFAGLLEEAQKRGQLRGGFDLSVVRMLMLGALTWVAEWYDPEGPMTPDDVADEMMRLLTGGIAK